MTDVKKLLVVFKPGPGVDEWTVFCEGSGHGCIVDMSGSLEELKYFVAPAAHGATYNSELADLTSKLNALMNEVQNSRKDKRKKLGLYLSPRGLMPVWKTEADELPTLAPGSKEFDVEEMSDEEVENLFWPKT